MVSYATYWRSKSVSTLDGVTCASRHLTQRGTRYPVPGFRFAVSDYCLHRTPTPDTGYRTPDTGYRIPDTGWQRPTPRSVVVAVIPVRFHLDYRAHPGVVAALKPVITDGKPGYLSTVSGGDVWRIRSLAFGSCDESSV